MKLLRRQFLQHAMTATVAAVFAPALAARALAQAEYPSRPVHILVGYAAGGVSDILARLIAKQLSDRLDQAFIVENHPGAGGNLAADQVVHAAPDGYTLLLAGMANAINVSIFPDLDFNFARDMAPVAVFAKSPMVMEVNPAFPAKTVPEFIAYAKAHPGEIAMGSAGTGGSTHVAGELFQMLTGTKFTDVPYHGSAPALDDLLGGRLQVMFDNLTSSLSFIRAGKLKPLALSTPTNALAGIPLISAFVPGYEAYSWNGITAPKDCPPAIVEKLNAAINASVADPAFAAQLAQVGNTPLSDTPAGFGTLIAADSARWAKVVAFAAIAPQ
ncbi:MAG TPA: tripartite tricarboxylate transporter substrate binding protein [Xanthobacteraceae bacterium]|nr:tripartite tricarboxylate transporter substrate binding protein [Xanthobacteraceae bacterium]